MTMMITTIEEQVMDACSFLYFWILMNLSERRKHIKADIPYFMEDAGVFRSHGQRAADACAGL